MSAVRLSRDLVASGYLHDDLKRLSRTGELTPIRRGAYRSSGEPPSDARGKHLELLEATVGQCSADVVVSHSSAALLHGLPIFDDTLGQVQVTRDRAGRGQQRRHVHVHGIPLPPSDVTVVDGYQLTTVARTVVDLGCTQPLARSVPVGDAALRQGLLSEELDAALQRARRRHGIGSARRCVSLLDGRSESVGESRSRVVFVDEGLPSPVPQYEVLDEFGLFVARVDFGWPELKTIGEFDGRIKYGRALAAGRDVEEVLFDEKRREDRLRDLGWQVVRWIWDDLLHPAALVRRLHRAFERGRR